jgi:MFS family permease
MSTSTSNSSTGWLNRTILGIGLTSLFSDWSHEMATAILPAFLASLGAGPGWLGIIEGVSDGLSSVTKLAAGHFTDTLRRRKPAVLAGYAITTLAIGSMAWATRASEVLLARTAAWLGRGARSPARKALLAAAAPPAAYGRAFGLERMLDTLGAIAAPATTLWLLARTANNYSRVLLWTFVPGLLALACFAFLVRESPQRTPSRHSFQAGLRALPGSFRHFVLAVGVFGLGDFSHTLLILYATQALSERGRAAAASIAVALYLLHNCFYAAFAYAGGWISDHVRPRRLVLAAAYVLAALMAGLLVIGAHDILRLSIVFALGGTFAGVQETLQDTSAAELAPQALHGMAFGTLAAVNAIGDLVSSLAIGLLWSKVSPGSAFTVAGVLFLAGSILLVRTQSAPE